MTARPKCSARQSSLAAISPRVSLGQERRAQGASPGEIDLTAFGFDHVRRRRVRASTGLLGGCEEAVLEETPDHVARRDRYGRSWASSRALSPAGSAWPSEARLAPHGYRFAPISTRVRRSSSPSRSAGSQPRCAASAAARPAAWPTLHAGGITRIELCTA